MLTVIALIGILATLLMTALTSARKASHRTRCISNLRQISLGLNMYLDDFDKRVAELTCLVSNRYLPNHLVLMCPSDKTGGWGSLVNPKANGVAAEELPPIGGPFFAEGIAAPRYSYLHPLPWEESAWQLLFKQGSGAGLAACQLHGLGRPNLEFPSLSDFQGLVLRAQRDGAVVKRQVFWDADMIIPLPGPPTGFSAPSRDASPASYPWQLFSDTPIP
jgi:hypothetical protein